MSPDNRDGHVTKTTVHLVRHGEVHNPDGVLYGRLPGYRLSEAGEGMARLAAEVLKGRDVTVVRSSPLERAVQTAAPIAAEFGVAPTTDDRLIESENFFEGKTFGVGDGSLRNPSVWRHLWNPFRPSWGEAYTHVADRVLAAVADARDAALGHEAVLVSHQLPIEIARRKAEGKTLWHRPDRRRCALASITSLVYEEGRLIRVDYAEPAGESGRQRIGGA
ncbi:MAG: histidine phosphatase family protein [Frankiaceae bacterium]|nr:histidine phosphatase family protein [Frankiaceae bacterium]MBV9870212.1 histidine phosphatase family protein [Frankiaceae bacterium]